MNMIKLKGKPRLFKGPASYNATREEIVREFSCGKNVDELANGLIAFRNLGDKLRIDIYSVDGPVWIVCPDAPNVKVTAPRDTLCDAAPELLAALRTAFDIAPNDMRDGLWGVKARAAIAKAEGKE